MNRDSQTPAGDPNLIPFVLWLAFMMSVGTFAFVTHTTTNQHGESAPFTLDQSTIPFFAIAAMLAMASLILPKIMLRAHMNATFDQLPIQQKAAKLFVPTILGFALAEAVGLFGVVVGITANSFETAIPFFAISLILLGLNKPKKI